MDFIRQTILYPIIILSLSVASASESIVMLESDGQELVGTLTLPDGDPAPVILLLHGFTGSRDELKTDHVPEGVFARAAAHFREAGFASLRIDFRGSGESIDDIKFAETTFEGQVSDAIAAIDYLKNSSQVASDDIHLLGWSQGGLVASAAAGRSEGVDAVALWAAVANTSETFSGIFGDDLMQTGLEAGATEVVAITLPWGAEIELNGAFFDGIANFDPLAEIKTYTGPLFVAQGLNDTTVLPASANSYIAAHDGPEQLWTADMDHVFNVFESDAMLDELIDNTRHFFQEHDD